MHDTDAPLIPAPSADQLAAYPGPVRWPLKGHLQLAPRAEAVRCARHYARAKLAQWHIDAEAAEMVVTELATNAVRASADMLPGVLRMWLASDHERVLVQVWDASCSMPVLQDAGSGAECGRGLMIVAALSEDWGAYRPTALPGKVTWAIVGGGGHERDQALAGPVHPVGSPDVVPELARSRLMLELERTS